MTCYTGLMIDVTLLLRAERLQTDLDNHGKVSVEDADRPPPD